MTQTEKIILEAYQEFKRQMDEKMYITIPPEEEENLAKYIHTQLKLRSPYVC